MPCQERVRLYHKGMMMKIRYSLFLLLLICAVCQATTITHIVAFGDSLTDNGYSNHAGFNRYSNGNIWIEYLANDLCQTCLTDYAWGGARSDSRNYHGMKWSGLQWQVKRYHNSTPSDSTLYFIWIGANDLITGKADGIMAVSNVIRAAKTLIKKGAKQIAILNLPDITLTPYFNQKGSQQSQGLARKIKHQLFLFNSQLRRDIFVLQRQYSFNHRGVRIYLINVKDVYTHLVDRRYFRNSQDAWLGTYKQPSDKGYMWWDQQHPMTSVHKIIAAEVNQQLQRQGVTFARTKTTV